MKNNSQFNIKHSKLIECDFGYKPDTSLEVGIERFVKWYKEFCKKGEI